MASAPGLGIIAGGGAAPRELIAACRAMDRYCFVMALEGQADPDLPCDAWLSLGGFGTLKKLCAEHDLREIVMLGRVRRPSIAELKPDFLGLKVLAKIGLGSLGDDGVLRAVSKAIEEECGARIVGAHEVFSAFLTPEGVLTTAKPDGQAVQDIARGKGIARALGALDVGQSVAVQCGLVLGLEAVDGTDALIERAGKLRREGEGGILVKCAKPQQDNRFDLPSIGLGTVEALIAAGFAGLAIEAGRSLFFEKEKAIAAANEAGLFILGFKDEEGIFPAGR